MTSQRRPRIIDIGCGPGQWTNYLHERGIEVEGVDPVPEFIDEARQRYPDVDYRIGHASRIDEVLAEFARCVRPGGGLAIGFCEGAELVSFDHAVTTAYFWPVDLLSSRVERAGFVVGDVRTRVDPGARPHGAIVAQRGT